MAAFICGEMWQRVQVGFSILIPVADTVRFFGDKLNLSCIFVVPHEHRRTRFIINLLIQPNEVTPSVNNTTYKEVAPELMQSGHAFPRILQAVWEAAPDKGPVRVSNMDPTDAYKRGTLQPAHVGAFAYIIPSAADKYYIIICINLVLTMGWVDSPIFSARYQKY